MRDKWTKMTVATGMLVVVNAAQLSAGGLSDQIVEEQQVMAPTATAAQNALPGWVLPAAGLLLLGAVVASGDDSSSDGGGGQPPVIDPK